MKETTAVARLMLYESTNNWLGRKRESYKNLPIHRQACNFLAALLTKSISQYVIRPRDSKRKFCKARQKNTTKNNLCHRW